MDDPRKRELAERRALERMRATKPQKACDIGLFSDSRNQIDLEDLLHEI